MQTLTIQTEVTDAGKVRVEVPCDLPPGPVEVEVTIRRRGGEIVKRFDWDSLYGIAKGTWADVDPVDYIGELREDRELP